MQNPTCPLGDTIGLAAPPPRRRRGAYTSLLGALLLCAAACSAPVANAPDSKAAEAKAALDARAADTWGRRCGACHERVQPGARTREALVKALAAHRSRVRLKEPEWAALVDFLAAGSVDEPPAPASAP